MSVEELRWARPGAASERRRRATVPTSVEFPVKVNGATWHLGRTDVEDILRATSPHGTDFLYHYIRVNVIDVGDFEAACAHFGLQGALEDITHGQIEDEMRARRERGDAPSTGMLPMFLDGIMPRERADARIAIVERRIAEARKAPRRAA